MSPLYPLLGLLARGEAYGYELKRIVESEFAPQWRIDFAQLYRSLAKLQANGFVRGRAAAGQGGPARRVYAITPRGRRALEHWLKDSEIARDEMWLQARFAQQLGLDAQLPLVIAGSDDPLLAHLAQTLQAHTQVVGSTAGLLALASQNADVGGTHLRDPEAGAYNVSFVQHLVAEQDVLLVNLAVREYGLMVARGNPKNIRSVRDLGRRNVRMLNRTPGSGARLWLQRDVRSARLDPSALEGWTRAAGTYAAVARAIVNGTADAGPGLRATAQALELDFVTVGEERFDLALSRALYESARAQSLRDALHSKAFRAFANALPGYDFSYSGRVVAEIKYGLRRKQ